MTDTAPGAPPRPTTLSAALSLAGAALVVLWLVTGRGPGTAPWAVGLAAAAAACWVARTGCALAGLRRVALGLGIAGALAGALAAAGTNGTGAVIAAVCVMQAISEPLLRPLAAGAVAVVAVGLVAIGAIAHPVSTESLVIMIVAVGLGALSGTSRRQALAAQGQAVRLRAQEAALQEEAARIAIARDLHDVLAHSLGGLVVQLDAADALLEAGDAVSARTRIVSARELAASGLGEARRAVTTLRAPTAEDDEPVAPEAVHGVVADLAAAHRALGGVVSLTERGRPGPMRSPVAVALERAVQESLSNARRHAPGAPVEVDLEWRDDVVRLTVSNPLAPPASPAASGGYGLVGMRERFAALTGGRVDAGERDGRFTVRAEASRGEG